MILAELPYLGAVFFGPLAFGCVEPWSQSLLETLLWLGTFAALWRGGPVRDTPVHKTLFLGVLAVVLLGLLQSFNPVTADAPRPLGPFTAAVDSTRRALLLWAAYAGLLAAAPQALGHSQGLRRLAWAIFLIGIIVAGVGLWQLGQGNRALYGLREVGVFHFPFGPYYNRNHGASLMVTSALVGFGIFFGRLAAWREFPSIGAVADLIATQTLLLIPLALLLFGVVRSGSRAALHVLILFAFAGFVAGGSYLNGRLRSIGMTLGALALLGYAAWVSTHMNYLEPFRQSKEHNAPQGSWSMRLSMYRDSLVLFRDSPLTGHGLGAFDVVFPPYQGKDFLHRRVLHVHSDWLELALETGLAGLAAVAAALLVLARSLIKSLPHCPHPELRQMAVWFLCAAGAFLLHNAVEFNFSVPANAVMFLLVVTWLGCCANLDHTSAPLGRAPTAVLALVVLCAAAASLRPALASWHLWRSERWDPAARPRAISRAISWDSRPDYHYALAKAYILLAQDDSISSWNYLTMALEPAQTALRAQPFNRDFRALFGMLLRRLEQRNSTRREVSS